MDPTAVDTNKDPVGYRGPGGVLGAAIEADFVALGRPESLEYLRDISLGWARHSPLLAWRDP